MVDLGDWDFPFPALRSILFYGSCSWLRGSPRSALRPVSLTSIEVGDPMKRLLAMLSFVGWAVVGLANLPGYQQIPVGPLPPSPSPDPPPSVQLL